MKFNLKFWEKLSPRKGGEDEKSLVPSRKPRVRLNLKGVKLSREVPKKSYQEVESAPQIELGEKKTVDAQPQQDSSSQNQSKGSGFRMPESFPFFGKGDKSDVINNDKKVRLDEDFLKDEVSRPKPWGLMFLIFSIILLIGTTIWVFWNSTVNTNSQTLSECKEIITQGVIKGLDTDDLDCGDKNFGLTSIFSGDNEELKEKVDQSLQSREQQVKEEISALEKQAKELQDLLMIFGEEPEEIVIDDKNYRNVVSLWQEKIAELEKQVESRKESIAEFESNFEYLLGIAGDLPVNDESGFFQKYQEMTVEEKFENFGLFKEKFTALQQKLESQESENEFVAEGVGDEEFFDYKIFEPQGFVSVFDNAKLLETIENNQDFSITGDEQADKRIIDIAVQRGYRKRPNADESKLISYGSERINPRIAQDLEGLQQAASQAGVAIEIVSGYRSSEVQQGIFVSRFEQQSIADNGAVYTAQEIIEGKADGTIDTILQQSSVPGYSKHHTGYTIDIAQVGSGGLTAFGNTEAYKWISANNYFNAKRFGFVPSYPDGAGNVGPDPEPWEYVWVGADALRN